MAEFPKWFNVNSNARIWSGHSDNHQKQGWLYAPAAIRALKEYKGSYKFEEWKVVDEGRGAFSASPSYPQLWIRMADVSVVPHEGPDPDNGGPGPDPDDVPGPGPDSDDAPGPSSDAEIGAAVRLLVALFWNAP